MMLGGVPISVTKPPSNEPNASGIRMTAGDRSALIADLMAAGISNAKAPTLFITVDNTPATLERMPT